MSKSKPAPTAETAAETETASETTSDIPAALSTIEWHAWRTERLNPVTMMRDVSTFAPNPDVLCKAIAIANDQLHDDDPRKLTADVVIALRAAADALPQEGYNEATGAQTKYSRLHDLADVIESYLPGDATRGS